MSVRIQWFFPDLLPPNFSKQRLLRATSENGSYTLVKEFDIFSNGVPVPNFEDINGNRNQFYQVRFFDPVAKVEFDDFVLGFFQPTPREKRFRLWIDEWLPEVFRPGLSDFHIGQAVRYSLNQYNLVPAFTNFSIDSLPEFDEQFIILGTKVWLIYLRYLNLSIRDFSYSDMGLSLNIDRGSKMKQAVDDLNKMYMDYIKPAKWRFTPQGIGLGSVYLPISLGAQISRNALSVLDIFSSIGR